MTRDLVRWDGASLRDFGATLKGADREFRREVSRAIGHEAKVIPPEIKQSARDTLPSTGGLGEWVAGIKLKVRQSFTGRAAGVTIVGTLDNKSAVRKTSSGGRYKGRRAGTFGARADLRAINRGRVMHPAWGRARADGSGLFGPQPVEPGFWDRPLEGTTAQRARRGIEAALVRARDALAARSKTAA